MPFLILVEYVDSKCIWSYYLLLLHQKYMEPLSCHYQQWRSANSSRISKVYCLLFTYSSIFSFFLIYSRILFCFHLSSTLISVSNLQGVKHLLHIINPSSHDDKAIDASQSVMAFKKISPLVSMHTFWIPMSKAIMNSRGAIVSSSLKHFCNINSFKLPSLIWHWQRSHLQLLCTSLLTSWEFPI